jgi:hypothetical protein
MKRRSQSYVCTLDTKSVADMQQLDAIRKAINCGNNAVKWTGNRPLRVVVRGRKPFEKLTVINRWTGKPSTVGYDLAGNIIGGIANASKLDVYVYVR